MSKILLGVGPTKINKDALREFRGDIELCRTDFSRNLVKNQVQKLNYFFGENRYSFAIPGSGSVGMEACLSNLLQSGDVIVVGVAGIFGWRIVEMAKRLGVQVLVVEADLGKGVQLEKIIELLRHYKVKLVCLVHLETSVGVLQNLDSGFSNFLKERGTLLLLDVVASYGGIELELDKWGVDIAYASTQKCLSAPSGLALISYTSKGRINEMNNITCFTDEISRDFETAADVLGEKQIREFDLRNMRTGRVPYISLEEEKEVEKLLSCYDYKINTISPAVGKLNIVEPELKFKTIKHLYDSIVFAKRHGIKNIIVFSFRKKNKYDLNETMPLYGWDILEEIVELGIKYDINIMFENHSSCFISTIDSILDFKQMERFHNNVYLNWDPNNSYQVSRKKYAGEYKEMGRTFRNGRTICCMDR